MAWRLAHSLEQLRSEANAVYPNRDKASDGAIGDASHAASASDHNPNAAGVVCAYDLDTDLDGTDDSNDPQMDALVEHFRTDPHPDLKYVIYRGRMFSRYPRTPYGPFEWRPYSGADPHVNHAHISVGVGTDGKSVQPYDDTTAWGVAPPAPQEPDLTPEEHTQLDNVRTDVLSLHVKFDQAIARLDTIIELLKKK